LGNLTIVKITDAEIEQKAENPGKVEQRKIQTIHFGAHLVLNTTVDAQYPKGFHQKV
jgi:hypothetical protein